MSNAEDRLRDVAARLKAEHEAKERVTQEQSAKEREELHARTGAARQEAQKWQDRAQSLVSATGTRIPFFIEPRTHKGNPGFEITVGLQTIEAELRGDGWHIVGSTPGLHPTTGLATDLPGLREQLLPKMVEQALSDVYAQKILPAKDPYLPD